MFSILRPYIFSLDPEVAHDLAIKSLKFNIIPETFFKAEGEEILKTWIQCFNLNASMCRFYNVYGPREPKSGNFATVVRKFIRQYKNKEPLTIVGDGKQRRDFTYVDDITDGLIAIARYKDIGSLFHLGRGVNYSINELASMFECETKYIPSRPGEYDVTLCDYSKVKSYLGYKPKVNLKDYVKQWLGENK